MPAGKTGREITMNIRMAAVAACALTLGGTSARADIMTGTVIDGLRVAVASTIAAGDQAFIDARATLTLPWGVPFSYDGISWGVDWSLTNASITLYDGQGNSRSTSFGCPFPFCESTPPPSIFIGWEPVVYADPGIFFPHYEADFIVRYVAPIQPGCTPLDRAYCILTLDIKYTDSTTITVTAVPGPVAGAGLPGLVLALGCLLIVWQRRRVTSQPL
jgi:hypothetical protein